MIRFASALAAAVALGVSAAAGGQGSSLAKLATPAPDSSLAGDRIYFVMTDRYANGDPANDTGGIKGTRTINGYDPTSSAWWHGGDLKGLTGGCTDPKHGLERIKDLGFNAIWITPVVENQISEGGDSGGYHGYWGLDFTKVDPHLGTAQDLTDFVGCAHRLGMKVILDVVVNHTGDVIQYEGGSTYSDLPYRDCHGKVFDPARYVGGTTFPCLKVSNMPKYPYEFPGQENIKTPAWMNDLTNYHLRGDVSCSDEQCQTQGDLDGLDDLFTEKPVVVNGLIAIYSDWITKFKLDGFRVDTVPFVNQGFWHLWVPKMLAAARSVGVKDFQIFGEVFNTDTITQAQYVHDGMPAVLDFPFQSIASGYAAGASSALGLLHRLQDDDYYRTPDGVDPTPPTFLGNHDMGRAAYEIQSAAFGLSGDALLRRVELGYDLLYLFRGAPVVMYGDEVGMIGTGGDQAARQDMFPTQVTEWQTAPRVGSPPIGKGSSFDVTNDPLEAEMKQLAALREANPALSVGWSIPRYAKGGVFVVSRIDPQTKRELVAAFDNTGAAATVTVQTSTAGAWTSLLGSGGATSTAAGKLTLTIPAVGAVLYKASRAVFSAPPPTPKLRVGADLLSSLKVASATVSGNAPVSVAFAWRKAGSGSWQRIDVDTSPPFRGFIDPAKFGKHEHIQVIAVARSLDGKTAVSSVVPFTVP